MFFYKILLSAALVASVSCRYVHHEDFYTPNQYLVDEANLEDLFEEHPQEYVHPEYLEHLRTRRQLRGVATSNPDGTTSLMAKLPLAGNDKNVLSAIGGADFNSDRKFGAGTAGLALDNVNGHGLTLTNKHIPSVGDQLTAAGKVNLFHNDRHNLDAHAFASRTMPKMDVPNFNTYGGKVDYMYNNKVGASLGAAHTDLFKKTDYSATGNLNLFRGRDSSLDFNAGFSKSVSPYIPSSSWQPSYGLSFSKYF